MSEDPAEVVLGVSEGLHQAIDAIWAPSATGVRVTLRRRVATRVPTESYLVLPHPRRPRLLLPADLGAARRAVGAYRGLRTPRAEVWSRVIRSTVLANRPLTAPLSRLVVEADDDAPRLLPLLANALAVQDLRAMLAVRRPEPVSKPTIGLLDASGHPVGYAKVGRSAITDAMVRNEAATLRALVGRLQTVVTPRLLAEPEWLGHPVSVLEPLPERARRCSLEPFAMAPTLWAVAASGQLGEQPLAGSAYHRRLEQRIATYGEVDHGVARLLDRWRSQLAADGATLRYGRAHGDWVTWNLGRHRGSFVVWDWEQSVPDAPVGFDACHWHYRRAQEAHGTEAAIEAVLAVAMGLPRVGALSDTGRRVAELYLLEASVAAAESGSSDAAGLRLGIEGAMRRLDVR